MYSRDRVLIMCCKINCFWHKNDLDWFYSYVTGRSEFCQVIVVLYLRQPSWILLGNVLIFLHNNANIDLKIGTNLVKRKLKILNPYVCCVSDSFDFPGECKTIKHFRLCAAENSFIRHQNIFRTSNLFFEIHINVSTCDVLRNKTKWRFFLCLNDLEKVRHAVISSSINYCNVLVSGVPALLSIKLIQNSAARKWMWASKYDYIISVSVHWLIVNAHIDYKLLFLTTKALRCLSTQYITDPLAAPFTEHRFIVIFQRDSSEHSLLCRCQGIRHCLITGDTVRTQRQFIFCSLKVTWALTSPTALLLFFLLCLKYFFLFLAVREIRLSHVIASQETA